MKRKVLYYYPSAWTTGKYDNPYSFNYKKFLAKYFNVLEEKHPAINKFRTINLIYKSLISDVFILNWIENIYKYKLGVFFTKLSIYIMHLRGKKVLWMFHNIVPHTGENRESKEIMDFLCNNVDLIISHSKAGTCYIKGKSKCNVVYLCHPITEIHHKKWEKEIRQCDIFIWGSILPYKGILEFISRDDVQNSNYRICILGKCKNEKLAESIEKLCNNNIWYDNRYADFSEIAAYCKESSIVLFPYLEDSVSSSGALIDTISLGGTPVGPNIGAFKDLAMYGVSYVYNSIEDVFSLIDSKNKFERQKKVKDFIDENSWENFCYNVYSLICEL